MQSWPLAAQPRPRAGGCAGWWQRHRAGLSEEIGLLTELPDEAVRGFWPRRLPALGWLTALEMLPLPSGEEVTGFLPWVPGACLPEAWLQRAPPCQIPPALGVRAPR